MFETKEVLRDNLSRLKDQLASETIRAQSMAREMNDTQADLQISREALKDTRQRLQDSYNQNQKLEKTIQDLRQNARKGSAPWNDSTPDTTPSLSRSNTTDSIASTNGLRELRLGRTASTKSQKGAPQFTKRTSSLAQQFLGADTPPATADNEALLLELVNAKTAEAVAKQELEEYRNKFENLKKMVANGTVTPAADPKSTAGGAGGGVGAWFGGIGSSSPLTAATPTATPAATAAAAMPAATTVSPTPGNAAAAGGGWGWAGWKRTPSTNNATIKQ